MEKFAENAKERSAIHEIDILLNVNIMQLQKYH